MNKLSFIALQAILVCLLVPLSSEITVCMAQTPNCYRCDASQSYCVECYPGYIYDTDSFSCITAVVTGFCGDSKVDVGEECDDGNTIAGDGCENNCTLTPRTTTTCPA